MLMSHEIYFVAECRECARYLKAQFLQLERYSHEGFLIKVVAMALAGEVTLELSPIRSWSNNNYDLKLVEKARERELQVREATSADTFPFARPAGALKILFTPAV